jgi:WD40 repeat protein
MAANGTLLHAPILATCLSDKSAIVGVGNEVKFFSLHDGHFEQSFVAAEHAVVHGLAYHPSQDVISVISGHHIHLWSLSHSKLLFSHDADDWVLDVAMSAGEFVYYVTAHATCVCLDIQGQLLWKCPCPEPFFCPAAFITLLPPTSTDTDHSSAEKSPSVALGIWCGSVFGEIVGWTVTHSPEEEMSPPLVHAQLYSVTSNAHNGFVFALKAHPTLPLLLSAGEDRTCRLWQLPQNMHVNLNVNKSESERGGVLKPWGSALWHPARVTAVAWLPATSHSSLSSSPTSFLFLSSCEDGAVRCWDGAACVHMEKMHYRARSIAVGQERVLSGGEEGAVYLSSTAALSGRQFQVVSQKLATIHSSSSSSGMAGMAVKAVCDVGSGSDPLIVTQQGILGQLRQEPGNFLGEGGHVTSGAASDGGKWMALAWINQQAAGVSIFSVTPNGTLSLAHVMHLPECEKTFPPNVLWCEASEGSNGEQQAEPWLVIVCPGSSLSLWQYQSAMGWNEVCQAAHTQAARATVATYHAPSRILFVATTKGTVSAFLVVKDQPQWQLQVLELIAPPRFRSATLQWIGSFSGLPYLLATTRNGYVLLLDVCIDPKQPQQVRLSTQVEKKLLSLTLVLGAVITKENDIIAYGYFGNEFALVSIYSNLTMARFLTLGSFQTTGRISVCFRQPRTNILDFRMAFVHDGLLYSCDGASSGEMAYLQTLIPPHHGRPVSAGLLFSHPSLPDGIAMLTVGEDCQLIQTLENAQHHQDRSMAVIKHPCSITSLVPVSLTKNDASSTHGRHDYLITAGGKQTLALWKMRRSVSSPSSTSSVLDSSLAFDPTPLLAECAEKKSRLMSAFAAAEMPRQVGSLRAERESESLNHSQIRILSLAACPSPSPLPSASQAAEGGILLTQGLSSGQWLLSTLNHRLEGEESLWFHPLPVELAKFSSPVASVDVLVLPNSASDKQDATSTTLVVASCMNGQIAVANAEGHILWEWHFVHCGVNSVKLRQVGHAGRDEVLLCCACDDGCLQLWRTKCGTWPPSSSLRLSIACGAPLRSVASRGDYIAVGGWDRRVSVWHLQRLLQRMEAWPDTPANPTLPTPLPQSQAAPLRLVSFLSSIPQIECVFFSEEEEGEENEKNEKKANPPMWVAATGQGTQLWPLPPG